MASPQPPPRCAARPRSMLCVILVRRRLEETQVATAVAPWELTRGEVSVAYSEAMRAELTCLLRR